MPQLLHILGHSIDEIKLGDFAGLERELAETRGSLEISTTDLADAAAYLERVSPIRAYDALLTVLDCKFRPGEDRRSKVEYYKRTFAKETEGLRIPEKLRILIAVYD